MSKSLLAVVAAALSILGTSAAVAQSGIYPFGDPPYRLDFGYDPEITTGCWKWNWQQYQWEDHCARYVYPKVYLFYGRPRPVVLRSKG
jgi:hypothetical protein